MSDIKTVDYQVKYCQTVDEQFQYSTKVAWNSEKESYFLYTLLNNLQEKYQKLLVSVAGGISDRSKKWLAKNATLKEPNRVPHMFYL